MLVTEDATVKRNTIKKKLGWQEKTIDALRVSELKVVLSLIQMHDEAEQRLEKMADQLSLISK